MSLEMVSFTQGMSVSPPDAKQPVLDRADASCSSSKFASVLQQLSDQEAHPREHPEGMGTEDAPTSGEVTSAQKRKQITATNLFLAFPGPTPPPSRLDMREESWSELSAASTSDMAGQPASSELAHPDPSKGQWADLSQAAALQTLSSTTGELVKTNVPWQDIAQSSEGIPVITTSTVAPVSEKVGEIFTMPVSAGDTSGKALAAQGSDLSSLGAETRGVSVSSFGPLGSGISRLLTSPGDDMPIRKWPTKPLDQFEAESAASDGTRQEVSNGKAEIHSLRLASYVPDCPSESSTKTSPLLTERVSDDLLLPADSENPGHEVVPLIRRPSPKNSLESDPLHYRQAVDAIPQRDNIEVASPSVEKANLTQQLEKMIDQVKQVHLSAGEATEMHVLLEPKELGKLALRISLENGVVAAHFDAESHIVKQLIEAQLPGLKDVLHQQGIHLEQVSVQVAADSGGGFRHPSHEPQTRQQLRKGNRTPAYRQIEKMAVMPSAWVKSGHSFDYSV